MSLKCGIVGLPNVGKSTLFSALAKTEAQIANFPFCTIDPQVGVIHVPDSRLYDIAKLIEPQKIMPATISFVDIAGLVKGASKGDGLGNQFLAHIRETDAILHLIRCFRANDIVHVEGKVDPVFDKQVIDSELQLKDLETLHKKEQKLAKLSKKSKQGDKELRINIDLLQKCQQFLEQGKSLRTLYLEKEELALLKSWQLLSSKPIIYVANIDEATLQGEKNEHLGALSAALAAERAPLIKICSSFEAELSTLPESEQTGFLELYKRSQTGLAELIQSTYRTLGLMTFFTAGKQEVRAWTIKKGSKAPQAAGVIHTDFEKKFIKAEIIKYRDFIDYKSTVACRQAGKIALEGREYEMQEGDIAHFKVGR